MTPFVRVDYGRGAWNLGARHANAPDDDPRRCAAQCRARAGGGGEPAVPAHRCHRWRTTKVAGSPYCWKHHKRYYRSRAGGLGVVGHGPQAKSRVMERLPVAYSRHLSKALAEAVDEARSVGLDLDEDLALMRVAALDSVKLYDAVATAEAEGVIQGEKANAARLAAGAVMKSALHEVASMAERAGRVAESRQNMLSGVALSSVLARVVEAAHAAFGDQPERVREFASAVRAIRAPSASAQGTALTPDMDVREMDASVPAGPPGDD